jgi:hypothetical protein
MRFQSSFILITVQLFFFVSANERLAQTSGAGIGAKNESYKIGPSIAMVLFQSRRVIGHWATVSAVTGWEWAR